MIRRIMERLKKLEIDRADREEEIKRLQEEIKIMDERKSKLQGFKEEYEQLVVRFTEFIKNEFTKK
ncbi:MAG: hypothetical protein IJ690_06360 [Clostridia bacterium]|nr:hypothetical protein [Clostridia bacterium]